MKIISKFKLHSDKVAIILLIFFVVPRLCLIFLIGPITAFAPDERNYLEMFGTLYNFKVSPVDYPGWPTNNRFFLQVVYGPAKILELIGLEAIYANRLIALFMSTIAFMLLLRKVQQSTSHIGLFLLISFFSMPSMFLWTILGIREPFIFILIVLIFHLLNLSSPIGVKGTIAFILLVCFLFLTKTYLYVYLIIAIWTGFILARLFKLRLVATSHTKIMPALVLIPLLLFPNDSIGMLKTANLEIAKQTTSASPTTNTSASPTTTEREFDRGQTLSELINQLQSNVVLSDLSKKLGLLHFIESANISSISSVGDDSSGLSFPKGSLSRPISIVNSTIYFLILPAPFKDNGSLIMNLLAHESVIWFLIYLALFTFVIVRIRLKNLSCEELQTILFSLVFIVGSGLVETNLGTSLRHRSILGLVLLGLILKEKISWGRLSKT